MRPIGIAPAARRRSTTGASIGATASASAGTPEVVGVPATSMFSLTVTGTPCSGPLRRRRVRRVGGGPRLVGEHQHDRVQVAVDGLDALQVRVDDLARGHLAARDQLGQLPGAAAPQLLGHVAPLVDPSAPYMAGIARGAAGSASRYDQTRARSRLRRRARCTRDRVRRARSANRRRRHAGRARLRRRRLPRRRRRRPPRDRLGRRARRPASPARFFAARGAQLDTPGLGGEVFDPAGPTWGAGMKPYSGKQLFTPVGSNLTDVRFNVPGTSREATTAAFGIVLSDVDTATGAALTFFDTRGKVIFEVAVPAGPNGLSFVSVRFTGGERVARVEVRAGAEALEPGEPEPPQADVAAIDDVIFGEPLADEAPPVEPEFVPDRAARRVRAGRRRRCAPSLIPLARKVRAGRTLKVVLGSSADASATLTLGKAKRTLRRRGGRDDRQLPRSRQGQEGQAEAQVASGRRRRRDEREVSDDHGELRRTAGADGTVRPMRRFAVLLLLAAAAALLPASKADAYKLFKHRWYSKTLTYYDATGGRYKEEIRAAASVLNRSGARIRVRSASRRSARVRISISRNLRAGGWVRRATRSTAGPCAARASWCGPTSGRAGRRRRRRRWRRSPCSRTRWRTCSASTTRTAAART